MLFTEIPRTRVVVPGVRAKSIHISSLTSSASDLLLVLRFAQENSVNLSLPRGMFVLASIMFAFALVKAQSLSSV